MGKKERRKGKRKRNSATAQKMHARSHLVASRLSLARLAARRWTELSRINSHSAPCTKLTETLWSSKPPSPAEQSTEQSRREAERGLCGSCFALYFASKNKCGANLPPCSTTERTHRREQRNTPYVSDGPVRDPRLCMCSSNIHADSISRAVFGAVFGSIIHADPRAVL